MKKSHPAVILAIVLASIAVSGCRNEAAPATTPTPEVSAGFGTEPGTSTSPIEETP